jgi:RNA polymerase sigma-70 factor (ECF subfamily)
LYGIALNALADEHRRNGAEARALARAHSGPSRAAADPDPAETLGSRDELLTALAQLAPEERDAVALRFGGDLTAPQIATVLGVSLTTAEGRVYRGLRKLRELLG